MVYFTSDTHLGHKNICKYRREFRTPEDHDEHWFKLFEALGKRDVVFVLGDFLFHGDHYAEYIIRVRKFQCRIKLIMGNHDSLKLYEEVNQKPQSPEGSIELQSPLMSYKNYWLSHCPIHPQEMRNRKGNIHGHLHRSILECEGSHRYFDVSPEKHEFNFVTLDCVRETLN